MDLISIIVPVYNVEKYLDECIYSIVNQTYSNLEIILVDDGSTDNSGRMCDEWTIKDSRIKAMHISNSGSAQARNYALDIAKGNYIAFVDSDDMLHRDFYSIMLRVLVDNSCDIVECDYTMENNLSEINSVNILKNLDNNQCMKEHLIGNYCSALIWNKLYKREIIRGIRFIPGKLIDDEFFTYKLLGRSNKTIVIDSVLYYYRQQDNSVMHLKYSPKRLVAIEALVEKYHYIRENYSDFEYVARMNIAGSCIFHGQMVLKCLSGKEHLESLKYLQDNYKKCHVSKNDIKDRKFKHKIWFYIANISFKKACQIRNLINIGF